MVDVTRVLVGLFLFTEACIILSLNLFVMACIIKSKLRLILEKLAWYLSSEAIEITKKVTKERN